MNMSKNNVLRKVIVTGIVAITLFGDANMVLGQGSDYSNGLMKNEQIDAASKFNDMKNHWSVDSISKAINKGYVDGYPDGTFLPDKNITRIEFIKLIVDSKYGKQGFKLSSEIAQPYVMAAVNYKLLEITDLRGEMNQDITRIELVTIVMRTLGKVYSNYAECMYDATQLGIVQGVDDKGNMGLYETPTRAQAVVIIERLDALNRGELLEVDKEAVKVASTALADVEKGTNIFSMLPELFNVGIRGVKGYPAQVYKKNIAAARIDTYIYGHKYTARVRSLTLVDYNDPNDPNRHLIPDLTDAYWVDVKENKVDTSSLQAWVLVPDIEVQYDYEDLLLYNVIFELTGFAYDYSKAGLYRPMQTKYKNNLGKEMTKNRSYCYFIPKDLKSLTMDSNTLTLRINTPSIVGQPSVTKEFFESYPDLPKDKKH